MEVKCGSGPAIKIKDRSVICHPDVKRLLEDSARSLDIPFQYEYLKAAEAMLVPFTCLLGAFRPAQFRYPADMFTVLLRWPA
jgi:hypothetical protein